MPIFLSDLEELMNQINEWSDKTFGEDHKGRRIPILYHLGDEVLEMINAVDAYHSVENNPDAHQALKDQANAQLQLELADCMILLLDFAKKIGLGSHELLSLISVKHSMNESRVWSSPDSRGVCNHTGTKDSDQIELLKKETD